MRQIVTKNSILMLGLVLILLLNSCSGEDLGQTEKQDIDAGQTEAYAEEQQNAELNENNNPDTPQEEPTEDEEMIPMTLKINGEAVQVKWENNESVKALMKMAEDGVVTVNMSMYGGFEQVGSLGTTLPSSDQNISTDPGDIVLYTSDHIVVFYGSNSWAYTRLGHIEDKSKSELQELLSKGDVVITISAE